MTEVLADDGHSWNKVLELEYYQDNVTAYGIEKARELSRANARSYRAEKRGQSVDWTLEVTDDGDMLTQAGASLKEVVEYNPFHHERAKLVGEEVRETARMEIPTIKQAMQRAMAGDKYIVFPEQHISSAGIVIRYFTVWEQDGNNTRLYHGKRIDLGKGMDAHEAKSKLVEHFREKTDMQTFQDTLQEHAFVFSTKGDSTFTSLTTEVHSAMRAHLADTVGVKEPKNTVETIVEEGLLVSRSLFQETNYTVTQLFEFLQRKRSEDQIFDEESHNNRSSEQILFNLLMDPTTEGALNLLSAPPGEQELSGLTEEEVVALWVATAESMFHIEPAEAHALVGVLEETHEEMVGAQGVIDVIARDEQLQEVLSPLLFLALDELAHPEILLQEAEDGVVEAPMLVTSELQDAVVAFFESGEDTLLESIQVSEAKEDLLQQESVDMTVLRWVGDVIRQIDQMPVEQAVQVIEHEEEIVVIQMSELSEVFEQLVADRRITASPTEGRSELPFASHANNEGVAEKESEHVESFSFAFALWMLLKLDSYYHTLRALKNFLLGTESSSLLSSEQSEEPWNLLQKLKEKVPEGLIQKETTQWLLLAIIWHLSMRREAGVQQTSAGQQSAQQNQAKKVQGVIFAYAT